MNLLQNVPSWSLGIAVLIIAIGVFLLTRRKGFFVNLKTKNIEISTSSENIYLVINKSIKLTDERNIIKYEKRLREQETYCEDAIDIIRSIILKNYRDILERRNIPNFNTCREYKEYEKIVYILLDNMRQLCVRRFEEMLDLFDRKENINDTYEYLKLEFEAYRDRIVDTIMHRASDIITNEWIENDLISREAVEEESQCILPDINKKVSSVFTQAIEIQLKYAKRLKELDREMEDFIKNLSGSGNNKRGK